MKYQALVHLMDRTVFGTVDTYTYRSGSGVVSITQTEAAPKQGAAVRIDGKIRMLENKGSLLLLELENFVEYGQQLKGLFADLEARIVDAVE